MVLLSNAQVLDEWTEVVFIAGGFDLARSLPGLRNPGKKKLPGRDTRAASNTTAGTQPSGCRDVSIAPCCSVNAAFLFAEPRLVVVVSRCAPRRTTPNFWLAASTRSLESPSSSSRSRKGIFLMTVCVVQCL